MTDNWDQRRRSPKSQQQKEWENLNSLYSLENVKKDYRLKKQRIHAGLWAKEIEKQEEARLGDSLGVAGGDDIEKLLDSCSEIFDFANDDLSKSNTPGLTDIKSNPVAGKQHLKLKMGIFGRCHRGKKTFCSKNLNAGLHLVNSR